MLSGMVKGLLYSSKNEFKMDRDINRNFSMDPRNLVCDMVSMCDMIVCWHHTSSMVMDAN